MVEAFVGLVGGGKSFNSVRRMMAYMARGGRVCSNILLTGWDSSTSSFSSDSPVLSFLRSIGWEYQEGQYSYISFDEMVTNPDWISKVPAGVDRQHRNLLVIDEATDLFDTLDGGRLRSDSQYREIFHFLRLSRHVHVDVLFIVQDLESINKRLCGLVANIWRSTDMKNFRLCKLRVPFPFDLFMLQQFDRKGKYELKREWVKKDLRVFECYESEAFNNSLSVKWDGVSVSMEQGQIKKKGDKKMGRLGYILLFVSVGFSVAAFFRSGSRPACAVPSAVSRPLVSTNICVSSPSVSSPSNIVPLIVRAPMRFVDSNSAFFDSVHLEKGMPCEWGLVREIHSNYIYCVSIEDKRPVFLYPKMAIPSNIKLNVHPSRPLPAAPL